LNECRKKSSSTLGEDEILKDIVWVTSLQLILNRKNDNKKYPTLYPILFVVSQEFPTFLWVFPGSRNLSTGDGGLEGKWKEED